jgi:hypothetical protein
MPGPKEGTPMDVISCIPMTFANLFNLFNLLFFDLFYLLFKLMQSFL